MSSCKKTAGRGYSYIWYCADIVTPTLGADMAFAFFRRRQKMVIIIMVVLMVAFLIGFRGFEIIFDRKIEKQSIGETRHGSIRYADIYSAEHDLNILANIGLARPMGQSYSYVPGSIEFQMITSRNNDPARTYA